MSTCTHESMTNHHEIGVLAQVAKTLHVWRHRRQIRDELGRWTERDLHDIGLSRNDIADEVSKPFWRA
jgi:uncharacterized protein YjiS (DUF1127 family)